MLKAPEIIPTWPGPKTETPMRNEAEPANTVAMLCNLTGGRAFCDDPERPHVPVLAAFGADPLHVCRLHGSWDLDRAVSENARDLVRSIRRLDPKERKKTWDDLTFQFGPRSFLYADDFRITGFAATPDEAERRVEWFNEKYNQPPAPSAGSFEIIKFSGESVDTETAPLAAATVLDNDALDLYYGDGFATWHASFIQGLGKSGLGLSILEGPPGTGKTSYLRHIMCSLKESHRFYFIPPSAMRVLSRPDFIDFWVRERRHYMDRKFVVMLEDAEESIMTRGRDNSEHVSAILNLSDGMLGDFFRLQIICTMNCASTEVDPALLRPGRLLHHRLFGRLDYPQARRLAESLGKKLPSVRDYSLAEVFAENGPEATDRPRIGFAT